MNKPSTNPPDPVPVVPATPPVMTPSVVTPPAIATPADINTVNQQYRRLSRRGLLAGSASVIGAYFGWRWLAYSAEIDGIPWPLRRMHEFNERLARAYFRPDALAPEFPIEQATDPRPNGMHGIRSAAPADADHMIKLIGFGGREMSVSIEMIRKLPRIEQITELKCIEGWSAKVKWAGARLSDLAAATGIGSRRGLAYNPGDTGSHICNYVAMRTPDVQLDENDRHYYVGIDSASALHPQTLLCYEMNDAPLTRAHGAPLRLVIPLKYGIKNIKRIGSIQFGDDRPADYWAERGYDWYSGH